MNNAYRGVQSVVARVSAKGVGVGESGRPRRPRRALLLNCHFDTVPDSPGQCSSVLFLFNQATL